MITELRELKKVFTTCVLCQLLRELLESIDG